MDESVFVAALSAISSGEYSRSDEKIVKERIDSLNKEELTIKRKMEKSKNEYSRKKDKLSSELKTVRKNIRTLKSALKQKDI